jgi:hypothetical protein
LVLSAPSSNLAHRITRRLAAAGAEEGNKSNKVLAFGKGFAK